jgi:hypothetical protein
MRDRADDTHLGPAFVGGAFLSGIAVCYLCSLIRGCRQCVARCLQNEGQPLPFAEEDLMEMRHLAGFILDFADEADLMARGRRAALELKISDELKRTAERGV